MTTRSNAGARLLVLLTSLALALLLLAPAGAAASVETRIGAALAGWSAAYRFSTQLFLDAPGADEGGRVVGNAYLRGSATRASPRRRSRPGNSACAPPICTTSSPG